MAKCSLECATAKPAKGRKPPKVREFIGPVKIVLVDTTPQEYSRNRCRSSIIAISIFTMGFVVMTSLAETLKWELSIFINLHIIFCTLGFQLVLPLGIYMMNPLFGPAIPLSIKDRKCDHIKIQLLALALITFGDCCVTFNEYTKETETDILERAMNLDIHTYSGILASTLATTSFVSGLCSISSCRNKYINCFFRFLKLIHMFVGVLCFTASTVSFVLGLIKPFNWNNKKLYYLRIPMAVCIVFNFFVIVWSPMYRYCGCD